MVIEIKENTIICFLRAYPTAPLSPHFIQQKFNKL